MSLEPARRHYLAVGIVSMALLTLEITVARVLSVALSSHYAFVAISLAMFGLGLSGLIVYLLPGHFTAERLERQLVTYAWGFGLSAVLSVLVFLHVHVRQEFSMTAFLTLSLAYGVLAIPFVLGGICVSLLMTHFSSHIGRIYFADLVGAGAGCMGVVLAMHWAPAPTVAVAVGTAVCAAALLLALTTSRRRTLAPAVALLITAAVLAGGARTDLLRMRYIKTWTTHYASWEGWNAFSRVSAFPSERNAAEVLPLKQPPAAYAGPAYPSTMHIDIDGAAWTPMMRYGGNPATIQFLRESVLYAAHYLKPGADVLIIGTGGGRDILAAVAFGQPSILGIEINPLMEEVVQHQFGDYSGRPYTLPTVAVMFDEARSRLATLDRRFDIIQLSLIDTFSLNAAGGFVFSENYLYTLEAFQEYVRHLSGDGVLSVTRAHTRGYTVELLRLLAMARAAWAAAGIGDARDHVVVLGQPGSATMLAKRAPYTAAQLAALEQVAAANNMQVLYRPGADAARFGDMGAVLTAADPAAYADAHPFHIDPPTDDRPFFFHFLRDGSAFMEGSADDDVFGFMVQWREAHRLMYLLIAAVSTIAVVFLFGPLTLIARRPDPAMGVRVTGALLLYFACLGYGFMMIEIPLLQRFVLFLGHPVYALAVVLFALLLFSGFGSLLSARPGGRAQPTLVRVLASVVATAALYAVAVPPLIAALIGAALGLRIAVTVALLAPIGLLLGMAYPLGIAVLREFDARLVPWAWGLNGTLSVVASVLAIFLGSRFGFTTAFWTGVGAYGIALVVMAVAPWLRASRAVEAQMAPEVRASA